MIELRTQWNWDTIFPICVIRCPKNLVIILDEGGQAWSRTLAIILFDYSDYTVLEWGHMLYEDEFYNATAWRIGV